jgi:hypothetical protein
LKAGGDDPLDFAREPPSGINLTDQRKSKSSVRKYEHRSLKALIAPHEDFKLIAWIDSVRRTGEGRGRGHGKWSLRRRDDRERQPNQAVNHER